MQKDNGNMLPIDPKAASPLFPTCCETYCVRERERREREEREKRERREREEKEREERESNKIALRQQLAVATSSSSGAKVAQKTGPVATKIVGGHWDQGDQTDRGCGDADESAMTEYAMRAALTPPGRSWTHLRDTPRTETCCAAPPPITFTCPHLPLERSQILVK